MKRFFVALVVGLTLLGCFRVYSHFISPMTAMVERPAPAPRSGTVDFQPPIFKEVSESYFSDVPWTKTADLQWQRSEDAFMYAEKIERQEATGNVVKLTPLAILWRDPRRPDAKPYRLIADSARVQFENQFFDSAIELTDSDPGRIVWSSLEGNVHIDGPDGMIIHGENFIFSEESAQLYSDAPIAFAYGPSEEDPTIVQGSSDGIAVSLVPSNEPVLGKDMPRVSGVSTMLLRENVDLRISMLHEDPPAKAHISSAGPFEFDMVNDTASFQSNVRVHHDVKDGASILRNELLCQWLGLKFRRENPVSDDDDDESKFLAMFDGLTFHQMRAVGTPQQLGGTGSRVVVKSQEHGVKATMQDLTWNALERVAVMLDDEHVKVTRGPATFQCPRVKLVHNEENEVQRLECIGDGIVTFVDERAGTQPVEASWQRRLDVAPEKNGTQHVFHLQEDAQIVVPDQVGLAADDLKMWVDMQSATEDDSETSGLEKPLPLTRFLATGGVRLVAADMVVKRSDSIDAHIQQGKLPPKEPGRVRQVGGLREQKTEAETQREPWLVETDEIRLNLTQDTSQGRIDVTEVTGVGNIDFSNADPSLRPDGPIAADGPLRLTGVQMKLTNSGQNNQTITLFGEVNPQGDVVRPAMLSIGETKFGGANLKLDRKNNVVSIEGPGALRVPIPESLEGEKLEEPAILEVVWQERMGFNGQTARFFGTVRCSVMDQRENISRLHCEELLVATTRRISFSDPDERPEHIELSRLEAIHKVDLEAYEYQGARLVSVRKGKLAKLTLNQESGDITGQGPGIIEFWSHGDNVKFAPTQEASANQPARRDPSNWRYTSVRFRGNLSGNSSESHAEIKDRIKVLSAPVDQALVKFSPEKISEQTDQASNTVLLDCDRLIVKLKEEAELKKTFATLFAYGNVDLEGQLFRAVADELTFDERVGRFVLRGLGNPAKLYFQKGPGEPVKPSFHRLIEFIPSKPSITVDGSTGLPGGL